MKVSTMITMFTLLCCSAGVTVTAQENVFLSRNYWKSNPSVAQIQKDIVSGNDATAMTRYAFDAAVYAMLEKVNDDSIKYLLSLEGNGIEKRTHDSRTYIFWAAYAGTTGIMEYLLEKGAKIKDITDSHGYTPVTFAASTGQKDVNVYNLFEKYGSTLTEEYNEDGLNSLFLISPYLTSTSELTYFQDKGFDINQLDAKGNNIFNHAAKGGFVPFLKALVEKGISPKVINKEGGNAILYASMGTRKSSYELKTFTYLESLGVNPNVIGDNNRNPLHVIASGSQDTSILKYFINKGVDVNLKDKAGITPFMNAANRNKLSVVQLLSKSVNDINLTSNKGRSALTMAVHRNTPEVVDFLIKKGAKTNVVDSDGNTLAYYVLNSFKETEINLFDLKLDLLQKNGLSISKDQGEKNTLLHIAADKNNLLLLKKLFNYNIDVNAKNDQGYTALHIASMKAKNDDILKYLLSKGADNSIKTDFEETAYDLALENELLKKNNTELNFLK